jgi:small subunit ribosomal protein S33
LIRRKMASREGLAYAQRIARLSAKIFGNLTKEAKPEDRKIVRMFARRPRGPALMGYYPPLKEMDSMVRRLRHIGLYRDGHLDFADMMSAKRTARGKGKPKKGKQNSFCVCVYVLVCMRV